MNSSSEKFENYLKIIIDTNSLEYHIPSIIECFTKLKLNKNQYLVEKGQACTYFCYLVEGVLQHSIDIEGEDKTTYLALENTSTSALKSFKQNVPSRKNIKALCDCNLMVIDLKKFNYLMRNNQGFQKFYHNLIENQIFLIDDYRINLLTLSPEERYNELIKNNPNLLQQIPLHYLASFLGISSRNMSRIRKI
ncbi:MAG: Crp/Fnr family transcriptional regulator [Flavobacteriaceae bacterium]